MNKIKLLLVVALTVLTFSFSAQAANIDGVSVYYSNNGPGMGGMFFYPNGYRALRLYNNSSRSINCRAANHAGEWVQTGTIWPGRYKDVGVGNVGGAWTCWYI